MKYFDSNQGGKHHEETLGSSARNLPAGVFGRLYAERTLDILGRRGHPLSHGIEGRIHAPASDVTIRFWQAGGDTAGAADIMNELLTKFTEETGIKVEYQAYPWANDPHVTFQTSIAGGDVADLLIVGSPLTGCSRVAASCLLWTTTQREDIKNDLMGVFANECVYEGEGDLSGKYISMPLYGDARTIFYNKAIFDEAGVEYPEESWTHEEFIEAAQVDRNLRRQAGLRLWHLGLPLFSVPALHLELRRQHPQ